MKNPKGCTQLKSTPGIIRKVENLFNKNFSVFTHVARKLNLGHTI